jgi:hypothetical protein
MCFAVYSGVKTYQFIHAPNGAVTLADCGPAKVEIHGTDLLVPRNGSVRLEYGKYTFRFEQLKKQVLVWKNSRGACTIRSTGGSLTPEGDQNVLEMTVSDLDK